ncbi:hypothetical protein DL766_009447 [Monosporascus sp. MC13-8B]|nr:hypothetical protein DL763_001602 [Monosporascus cannonballus]RYP15272.1 hypothetical protein DL766_009447 [Monosporascus sp. MC13-8B]
MELLRLAYYFDGPVVDTGESLGDIVVSPGLYMPAADSRVYSVVPADSSKLPVVAVSLNHHLHPVPRPPDQGEHTAVMVEVIVVWVIKVVERWKDPRFDRYLFRLSAANISGYFYIDRPAGVIETVELRRPETYTEVLPWPESG